MKQDEFNILVIRNKEDLEKVRKMKSKKLDVKEIAASAKRMREIDAEEKQYFKEHYFHEHCACSKISSFD